MAAELNGVFTIFAQNAKKLSSCDSTLMNESFNSVATKASKAQHYCGSESLDYRVKVAACQKNIGHSYVSMVRNKVQFSLLQIGASLTELGQIHG